MEGELKDSSSLLYVVGGVVIVLSTYLFFNMGSRNSKVAAEKAAADAAKAKKDAKAKADASKSGNEKKYPAGPLKIFFGSQTGTAEGFARTVMEEGKARGFDAETVDLEEYDKDVIANTQNAIFLVATYGEGEPTDNAAKFFAWIKDDKKEMPEGHLSKLGFSVFGLGNKQYEHYNRIGKLTDKFLEQHGGKRICSYGEGDDDCSLEEDFDRWRESIWPVLVARFHPDGKAASSSDDSSISRERTSSIVELEFRTVTVDASAVPGLLRSRVYDVVHGDDKSKKHEGLKVHSSTKFYFTAQDCNVLVNRELRLPADGGSTRHIEIDISGSGVSYHTADNLAVLPENTDAAVTAVCSCLGYNPKEYFLLEPADAGDAKFKHMFPTPCTIDTALRRYCDIQGVPRHSLLISLIPFVSDDTQRAWLENITDKNNRALYKTSIDEAGHSLASLLSPTGPLSSCRIPLADFLNLAPRLQPRYYTISSSSSVHPQSIHITVSLTEKTLPDGRKFVGCCTGDLVSRQAARASGKKAPKSDPLDPSRSKVRVYVRPSTFQLPASLSTPILMIGPGTGIAPMRALLQEREWQATQRGNEVGHNVLYFGCKSADKDYIYSDELAGFQSRGVLSELHVAFSRAQNHKVYVQNLMTRDEDSKKIAKLVVEQGGYVYVCGATAMGHDVHEALVQVLKKHKGMSDAQANEHLKTLQSKGRYVQELWSQ